MFYDVYQNLCKDIGKSATGVALELNIARGTVSNWKKTGTTPQADILQKVADYFNVSIDYLLEKEEETSTDAMSADDETIIIRQSLKDRPYRKVVFYVDPRVSEEDIADAIEKVEALALVKELKESGKLPDALK